MKKLFLICTLFTNASLITARDGSIFGSIKDWISGTQHETDTMKYTLTDKENHITVKNFTGNIAVKTWDNKNQVLIEVAKGGTVDALQEVRIDVKNTKHGLAIKTVEQEAGSCCVDYTIIIPKRCSLTVETERGNISIINVTQPITANTYRGSINIVGGKSIQAQTKYGNVAIESVNLQKTDKILAHSTKGNIKLSIPENTSASLYAKTERGKVTTEQKVSLNKVTTEINNRALAHLRKDINGSIGSLTDGSEIRLLTNTGSIRIQRA